MNKCYAYRAKHGGKSEQGCHPHAHPARDRLCGDEERQPGEDLEHDSVADDDTTEDMLTTKTAEGM